MPKAVWRAVEIPVMGPGETNAWGMYSMDKPTGATMTVYKAFCRRCGTLCYKNSEHWFCPKCRELLEGIEYESQ